jgi:hypothetical protein
MGGHRSVLNHNAPIIKFVCFAEYNDSVFQHDIIDFLRTHSFTGLRLLVYEIFPHPANFWK